MILSRRMSQNGTGQSQKIPTCPVARFWACPVVPLSRDKTKSLSRCLLCPGTIKGHLSLCPAGQENLVPLESLLHTTIKWAKLFFKKICNRSMTHLTTLPRNELLCHFFLGGHRYLSRNGFHMKLIFGIHGNWKKKNQNPGGDLKLPVKQHYQKGPFGPISRW